MDLSSQLTETYPLLVNVIWFLCFLLFFICYVFSLWNRLYGRLKKLRTWYVCFEKICTPLALNNFILFILFMYIFGKNLTGFPTAIGLAGAALHMPYGSNCQLLRDGLQFLFVTFLKQGDRVLFGGNLKGT